MLRAAATNTEWNFHDPKALDALKLKMLDITGWVDDGGIINREPPKPETQVNVQLLSRNPDTGEVNLKITPVNGNKVLYELGHNSPSSASMDVAETEGGERLIKFEGTVQGVIIDVFANDESASLSYSAEGSTQYTGEDIKTLLEKLQGVMKGSQVSISVEEVNYKRGQQLIDWLAEVGRQLQPGEVRQ